MTKIITRSFETATQAHAVRSELIHRQRFSPRIIELYDAADGLTDHLSAAHVDGNAARAYAKQVDKGGAVVLVRAGHKPLCVAQTTREVTAAMGALDLGNIVEEVEVKDEGVPTNSILRDHPLMLTRVRDPLSTNYYMANWPIPLISRRKPFREMLFEPHARMADWPFGLLSKRKPFTGSIFAKHARMANFPIGLISHRKPFTGSIFARHARMANFPIPLISRRKPFTGTIVGRHTRMASVPFPLLINGKSENSLIPGGPRMANFPISLISHRKPFTGSIFGRHARMANFPIGLISHRKPYTGSIVSKHGRMADMFLPLTVKHADDKDGGGAQGFSLSKTFGMPTVIRR